MAVGNIYLISAIAIIGGGLFGFDIASVRRLRDRHASIADCNYYHR